MFTFIQRDWINKRETKSSGVGLSLVSHWIQSKFQEFFKQKIFVCISIIC